ncbi:MAG TPA: hypothetical protein PKD24_01525 [Pyrinomonadaceae bacterium]|nr:hypothetical protein [Pyrinomonadaceae bacterium]HMP64162.1 hypothetical protein [Pyrinomonadaceae bacterium]
MKILTVFATLLFMSIWPDGMFGQSATAYAQASAIGTAAGHLPLSAVKEGMRGTAHTVFNGTVPEPFEVEILGVIPGAVGPKQDLIVGRLSGGKADRTAVFAGMSGSPVYVDGKLIGAISYSFPFSKEPICGITPIEQMVSIFEHHSGPVRSVSERRAYSFTEMASAELPSILPAERTVNGAIVSGISPNSMLMAVAGQSFRPIGTPLTFTGFSQRTLDVFAAQLLQAGLVPVSAVGGAAPISPMKEANEKTLAPGTSVMMQLTRGDYSLAASGTVTTRDGDRIYAFGHPFLSLGTSELPMSESSVVTVIPSVNNSFKLAVPGDLVGTMTQDRATGVFGLLGKAPKMIPIRMTLQTSRGQKETLNVEVARDDFLTPLLLNITIFNSIVAQERGIGDTTVNMSGTIELAGNGTIRLDRRFSGSNASMMAAMSVAGPVNLLMRSRFSDLDISGIDLEISSVDGSRTAALERIAIDRQTARPGETVELRAFARTSDGQVIVERIPFSVPAGTPAGEYTVMIGDGTSVQRNDALQHFVPSSLRELAAMMNQVKTPDRLYARLIRTSPGAVIGASEMPNLPPSVLATLNSDRMTGGIRPVTQNVVSESLIPPAEFIISGEQTLKITVVR